MQTVSHTDDKNGHDTVIQRALAAVEKSRERRERWGRESRERFERIQIASMKQPAVLSRPGRQLSLRLDG